jgi:hypothetical protein
MPKGRARKNFFKDTIAREFFNAMAGPLIGKGIREVYAHKQRPDLVIKIDGWENCLSQNVAEWLMWNELQHTEAGKWLAPCVSLSSFGSVLIQKRTTPIQHGKYPEKVPTFLCDFKYQNFGMYKGRFVCHDYGLSRATTLGASANKLAKVDWWDAEGEL